MIRKTISPLLTGLALAWAAHAPAASVLFDFNSDPTANGLLTIYGSALWIGSGGVGSATNSNDGFLLLTPAVNSQNGAVIFADFDNGAVVQGFTFETDVRIGNGTSTPADGFSINYVRSSDPILTQATNNPDPGSWTWGTSPAGGTSAEEGSSTGIGIGFDAYANGGTPPYPDELNQSIGPDIVALSVRVDGILVLQYPMPTLNGSVTDPTSLQTGPIDASDPGDYNVLGWAHLKVDLSTTGVLNVYYKNTQILSNFQTSYFPSPGRLVLGALNENQDVDNILITTIPATVALVGQASGLPDGFSITIGDSGTNSIVDTTKPVTATLNGANATPLTVTKSGSTTTIIYHGFPLLLTPGSTNVVTVAAKDTNGNAISGTQNFVVPAYSVLPASDMVTNGVNTSLPGFRIMPWQSPTDDAILGEPNAVHWVQEQLMGLHGANNATVGSDAGYYDYRSIINFNINPASSGGTDEGNFQTSNGYPDSLFPGIPGANGLNGSTALEVLSFLQFNQPGIYHMGVNSDDGFAATEGKNPRDRFALLLGEYDGGRGSSDTIFTFAVTNAGIYPFRLAYENGAGELPGNGANLEWFMVDTNGVKILVNDPSATNDTGVTAFYAGPAFPAFVSQINPYISSGSAVPHKVLVQLTDGTTTVNGTSIQFNVDGSTTPAPVITKTGLVTTATLSFNPPLAPGSSHTATLVWSDSAGTTQSNTWPFTVESYVVADISQVVPASAVDTSQPGFVLHVAHIDYDNVGDSGDYIDYSADDWANAMLAGSIWPWWGTNTIDTVTVPPVASNMWYWSSAVDFNIVTSPGDYSYDYALPGIPGPDGKTESFAAGFDGWIVFPQAGYYRMSVSSDDGFRLSQGIGFLRQVLHIKGSNVDRDVAACVNDNLYHNSAGFGVPPPLVPITAPVFYVTTNNYVPGINLSNKIAVVDSGFYGASDAMLAYIAQTNGALAFIELWPVAYGCPNEMGGTPPGPVNIPCLVVNSFNGEHDTWTTNTDIVATIGASQKLIWGAYDNTKGMGRIDIPVIIPTAGAYPLHLTYWQCQSGAGLEWQTYNGYDGVALGGANTAIIGDTNTPTSMVAYRAVTSLPTPTLSVGKQGTSWVITYTGVLRSCATVGGSYQPVSGASSPYTVPTSAAPMMFYRAYSN